MRRPRHQRPQEVTLAGPARKTELSRWIYQRCRDGPKHRRRAQSSHAIVQKINNRRAVPAGARHLPRAPTYPPTISPCKNKAPRTTGGDVTGMARETELRPRF